MGDMVPPARITAWASVTMDWKEVEGSRRRNLRVIVSVEGEEGEVEVEGSLVKKRRPSFEGWVSAERREEMWCRTSAEDSFWVTGAGLADGFVEAGEVVVVWTA